MPLDGIQVKHAWDLPTLININARSLNAEKVDELQIIVDDIVSHKHGLGNTRMILI